MPGGSEHQYSMAFAGAAFEKMRDLHHAPTPPNYEIWYHYAGATNQPLNAAINDLMASRGAVSQSDLDELHDRFFSPTRLSDQIDGFGIQVMGEIDQIMASIDGTLNSTSKHTESLADMSAQIDGTNDPNDLRNVISRLVKTAREIEQTNQKFEANLKESRQEINQLQKHLDAVRTEILTDPLTTLSNRKHFDQAIVKAIAEARANNTALSLLMTDIDHFKKFNDSYGHLTGDQVLRLVALSLKHNVKGQDLAARYGGEEFAVILPNTALRQATIVGEHIRRAVMQRELMKRSTGENLGYVTISLGVATLRCDDTPQSLMERADTCLYSAKRSGRNRVVNETDPGVFTAVEARVA
jgi:diguanylate cyclase